MPTKRRCKFEPNNIISPLDQVREAIAEADRDQGPPRERCPVHVAELRIPRGYSALGCL